MRKLTKLEKHLINAGITSNKEASKFLNYSESIVSKLRAGNYNPKDRTKDYIIYMLNKKLNLKGGARLKIEDVFTQ